MQKELIVGTEEFIVSLWDKFNETMKSEGYKIFVNNNVPGMTTGTVSFMEDDKYVPIISLNIWEDTKVSIFVEDRNGNVVIDGNTVAIHSLKFTSEDKREDVEKRFNDMVMTVVNEYKKYNKQNRLNFDVDENEEIRKSW